MGHLPEILDAATTLRHGIPPGFDGQGPALALAVVGVAAWLRWMVLGVRRVLDE